MQARTEPWLSRWSWLVLLAAAAAPALGLRAGLWHAPVVVETVTFGVAVVAAAFILTWTAEAAEHDVSQALALAVLALIAVLPEYAVDLTFAWKAGQDPHYAQYAAANMTGGNRLLVGLGWSTIVLIFFIRSRRTLLELARSHQLELTFLGLATLYSFLLPLKASISLLDSLVLMGLFLAYLLLAARHPAEEPELMGPARVIGALPARRRRPVLVALFVFAAGIILASAEPFAEGLVHTGIELGIDEFLLVQWVAPLASEAPEFIAAGLMAWRMRAAAGMGALISSKVNQWTLLIGGLPIAFAISGRSFEPLPLDARQIEEVFLTAAQSLFAVAVLLGLAVSLAEGALLAVLFITQAALPTQTIGDVLSWLWLDGLAGRLPTAVVDEPVRWAFAFLYLACAVFVFWRQRRFFHQPWRAWFGEAVITEADFDPQAVAGRSGPPGAPPEHQR
jgi:cation:H+ antiporter